MLREGISLIKTILREKRTGLVKTMLRDRINLIKSMMLHNHKKKSFNKKYDSQKLNKN